MPTRKPWAQRLMLSLPTKETAFGTAVAVAAADYDLMSGYTPLEPDHGDDNVITNAEEAHGAEYPTEQEIIERSAKIAYVTPKLYPNELAGLAALCLGDHTPVKDGAFLGYQHYMKQVAEGTELDSITGIFDPVNAQETYVGLKGAGFEISSEAGGGIGLNVDLMGSGKRTGTTETFQSAVVERLLRVADTKIYLNPAPIPATDFVTPANFDQSDCNIDGAVPALSSIGARVKSWRFAYNGNMEEERGHGGLGYAQGADYGTRTAEVELVLRYADETERDYYENQTDVALEFNNKHTALIDAAGAWYWGFILRIPKVQLAVRPDAKSNPYEITLTGTIMDDGTNEPFDLTVYNEQAAYLG